MTSPATLHWLNTDFEQGLKRYQRKLRLGDRDRQWHGPSEVRPMIQLLPPPGRSEPMRITHADYHDPDRWWL